MLRGRRVMGAAAALLVLVACTEEPAPEPSPTPTTGEDAQDTGDLDDGYRVAVVIGPSTHVGGAEAAALEAAAEAAAAMDDVDHVRTWRAESVAFAADLAQLAVDDGYDLVCVVGAGTRPLLEQAAQASPATRFCGTAGGVGPLPSNVNVAAIDLDSLLTVMAAAVGPAPSPVGLLVADAVLTAELDAVARAFEEALPSPPPPSPAPLPQQPSPAGEDGQAATDAEPTAGPSPSPSPSSSPVPEGPLPSVPADATIARVVASATGRAEAADSQSTTSVLDASPSVTVLLTPVGGAAPAQSLAESGARLVLVDAWAVDEEGQLPASVLLALRVDWEQLLTSAITAVRTDGAPQVQLLGVGDGLFSVVAGPLPESPAAMARALEVIDAAASAAG